MFFVCHIRLRNSCASVQWISSIQVTFVSYNTLYNTAVCCELVLHRD